MAKVWYVDIPSPEGVTNDDASFVAIDIFHSREEAIAFCKESWGADEEGRVSLITEGADE